MRGCGRRTQNAAVRAAAGAVLRGTYPAARMSQGQARWAALPGAAADCPRSPHCHPQQPTPSALQGALGPRRMCLASERPGRLQPAAADLSRSPAGAAANTCSRPCALHPPSLPGPLPARGPAGRTGSDAEKAVLNGAQPRPALRQRPPEERMEGGRRTAPRIPEPCDTAAPGTAAAQAPGRPRRRLRRAGRLLPRSAAAQGGQRPPSLT